ncbi:DUF11 domain-containing protein [Paenibacillus glycinis]|uniref:DUF11 domain-containing protein n=1 Tax=Paenibacillus glycinis TaxID=2697035 RepID=A0ABW9XL45_9BACL|nr:DUF11 domain-containing protein [Paenibacillus glycinis]NBD23332.1 DUF11 domain-containing protein [Paenibacillus glycinis]
MTESLPQTVSNQSVVTFDNGTTTEFAYSNTVNTQINGASIAIAKFADAAQAGLSLPVTYRITVGNSGNRAANVIVYDSLPPGTIYVPNSILVNGTPVPGIAPGAGIPLGEVNPGSVYTIVYQLILTVVPPSGVLENQALADYTFVTLDHRVISGSSLSNVVTLPVTALAVSLQKSVSTAVTFVGDMITYSVIAANEGSEPLRQSVLFDPLPSGTGFVPGSVTINGVRNPSASPAGGIPLGIIEPGTSRQILFNAVVLEVPVQTRLTNQARLVFNYGQFEQSADSNPVTAIVYGPALSAVIDVAPELATIDDILTYTVFITNAGTLDTSVVAKDLIPSGTAFVQGSVVLNGVTIPGADPVNGVALGFLPPGLSFTLTYNVTVTRAVIQPLQPVLVNRAILEYAFRLPNGLPVTDALVTNTVVVPLVLPVVTAHLEAKPELIEAGETFQADVRLTNNGNYSAYIALHDIVPSETTLVPDSVFVDGNAVSAATGEAIPVGTLPPDGAATVTYLLRVFRHPLQHRIRFRVRAAYSYVVNKQQAASSVFSNEATVRIESDDE